MSYGELKDLLRTRETAELGPGSYFGNALSFGKGAQSVLISPPKGKAKSRNCEISLGSGTLGLAAAHQERGAPGPGVYNP